MGGGVRGWTGDEILVKCSERPVTRTGKISANRGARRYVIFLTNRTREIAKSPLLPPLPTFPIAVYIDVKLTCQSHQAVMYPTSPTLYQLFGPPVL